MVLRPRQHSIGYMRDGFTGQKTQPTVSKYWRNTKSNTANPLIYTNMGWRTFGDRWDKCCVCTEQYSVLVVWR